MENIMKLFIIIILTSLIKWFVFEELELSTACMFVMILDLVIAGYWLFVGFKQVANSNELYQANDALLMAKNNLNQLLWIGAIPIIGSILMSENFIDTIFFVDLVIISIVLVAVNSWALITTISNAFKRLEGTSVLNNRSI